MASQLRKRVMKVRASRVELEAFCHATEDEPKVRKALLNLVPEALRKVAERRIRAVTITGHYGNPIRILKLSLTGHKEAEKTLSFILKSLTPDDVVYILNTIGERVDPPHLYIRVDKQSAYLNTPRALAGDDTIRVKVTVNGASTSDDVEEYLEALTLKLGIQRPQS